MSRLGRELSRAFPAWGRLAPEFAANCGPRWGEQFQLTADDVHPDGCPKYEAPHLHIDWQIDAGAEADSTRRTRPKGNKTRIAPIPPRSFTGYELLTAIRKRVGAALAEQEAGTNRQALLFPATEGGLLWHSHWNAKILLPAMAAADWPLLHWTEHCERWNPEARQRVKVSRERTNAELVWRSLRHRFARVAIDLYDCRPGELMALGGWENEATVQNRYYKSGEEHTVRGLARSSA